MDRESLRKYLSNPIKQNSMYDHYMAGCPSTIFDNAGSISYNQIPVKASKKLARPSDRAISLGARQKHILQG